MFQTQPGITDNTAHREGVHWIMARNCKDPRSVRHNNVCALAENVEACFFQRCYGSQMIDPW